MQTSDTTQWLVRLGVRIAAFRAAILAIGLAGLVQVAIGRVAGAEVVTGEGPGVTYTTERCAEFAALRPDGSNCLEAAQLHHLDEIEQTAVAGTLIGGFVLGAFLSLARRHPDSVQNRIMAFVGLVGFGGVGIHLAPLGFLELLTGGGNVSTLILGTVSLAFAAGLVAPSLRSARWFASKDRQTNATA